MAKSLTENVAKLQHGKLQGVRVSALPFPQFIAYCEIVLLCQQIKSNLIDA